MSCSVSFICVQCNFSSSDTLQFWFPILWPCSLCMLFSFPNLEDYNISRVKLWYSSVLVSKRLSLSIHFSRSTLCGVLFLITFICNPFSMVLLSQLFASPFSVGSLQLLLFSLLAFWTYFSSKWSTGIQYIWFTCLGDLNTLKQHDAAQFCKIFCVPSLPNAIPCLQFLFHLTCIGSNEM